MHKFTNEQLKQVEQIVYNSMNVPKEQRQLMELLIKRRRYTRLAGHTKLYAERLCQCGERMTHVGVAKKSGGWECPKEEREWDFIFFKLKSGAVNIESRTKIGGVYLEVK